MATQWVLGKISDALQPTVQNAVGTAGSFAGGAMNSVGTSINGVGERINTGIRYYGDGAKDYGNSVMDWTKAPAPRAQTASNPLGLSQSAAGGKAAATSPSIYRAPTQSKPKSAKTVTTASKPLTLKQSKALPNTRESGSKAPGTPIKKAGQLTKLTSAGSNNTSTGSQKKTISPQSRPNQSTRTRPPRSAKQTVQNISSTATNPMRLSK